MKIVITDKNYELIAELYGIVIPINIKDRLAYVKEELNYLKILLKRNNVTMFNLFQYKSLNDLFKIMKFYTMKEIIEGSYPIKVYQWENKKNLIYKLWNMFMYVKKSTKDLDFLLKQLEYYYDREFEWQHILYNHHIFKQAVGNKFQKKSYTSEISNKKIHKLSDFEDRLPYSRSLDTIKSVIHWGQRKLLITELLFMMMYSNLSKYIVYIGASTGTHIKILAEIWKDHEFHFMIQRHFIKV
jgi:hypothetical protein